MSIKSQVEQTKTARGNVVESLLAVFRDRYRSTAAAVVMLAISGCGGPGIRAANLATTYPSIDQLITSCNASSGCAITLPPGTFVFTIPLAPRAMFSFRGAGASWDNPGIPPTAMYPTPERHCLTRLIWEGGSQTPFEVSSYHLQGSRLAGFCLDATTSPDTFIDIDNFASGVTLSDIVIDDPQVEARIAGIRYGATGPVANPMCSNVFVRAAAPIGFDVLFVRAHFVGDHCSAVWNGENEWVVGDVASPVESFHCVFCTAEARPGNVPIVVNNAIGFWWTQGYFECGGSSTAYCVDIPDTAVQARNVVISDSFVGGDSSLPGADAFVHSDLASAILTITGNQIDYVFANPAYILKNDAVTHANVTENTMTSAGSGIASSAANVCSFGNVTSLPLATAAC